MTVDVASDGWRLGQKTNPRVAQQRLGRQTTRNKVTVNEAMRRFCFAGEIAMEMGPKTKELGPLNATTGQGVKKCNKIRPIGGLNP